MKYIKYLLVIIFFLFITFFLAISVKGQIGNPIYYQTQQDTRVEGPFESSNSTARYALTESIVDNHSLLLTKSLAKFASPDVVSYKGEYISIFTPGVSLIGVPFYLLGKMIGLPQIMTYASVLLFSIINVFLIAYIAIKFGAKIYSALLSGFIFLFATDAFAYALSFTQHQESVTVLLLAFINTFQKRTLFNNLIFGALFGIAALLDIPNMILLLPLGLYIVYKHFQLSQLRNKVKISFQLTVIGLLIGLLPLLGVFAWYNYTTDGSYTKIAQFIGRSKDFSLTQPDPQTTIGQTVTQQGHLLPFDTRIELNGMYTLLFSDERAWIYYSPIVFIGLVGFFLAYRHPERRAIAILGFSVVLVDIVLYSLFGDPWGGWSFGPRYLIPAAALLCTGIGVAIERWKNNALFIIIFFGLLFYSLTINAAGAFTTSAIPPKVEAIHLANPIPYTYAYNFLFIAKNQSSSLLYNLYFIKYVDLSHFLVYFVVGTSALCLGLYGLLLYQTRKAGGK